ncbi:glycosyltransferase family 4 protein [Methanobacterium formicicum]|uniref:glycosyltransferase family 4 protein n=1 Tax=Methanobacterium formicicum TaxID=2162 RepID=UPI002412B360|nr:glycosyltransferase family 4 protein [Methanobacterium formicicum]MDG3547077.1 glycosyltransferase family 4 protein [Methanobacterium formicicum]
MKPIKVLFVAANYPNEYYMWGPWNKEANVSVAASESIMAETIAPLPYSLPFIFFPYYRLSKIPLVEYGFEGKIHRPRFFYLLPKKLFYRYAGFFYHRSIKNYCKNLPKPDLVHCHHVYPDGYAFIKQCQKWDIPLIVDIHSTTLFKNYAYQKDISNQIHETLDYAEKIICISQEIHDCAIFRGIKRKKLEVIPLGVDTEKFKSRNKLLCKKKIGIEANFILLFVGHLEKMKGVYDLILAISQMPKQLQKKIKVIIIGIGSEKKQLSNLVKKFGLDENFLFLGEVKRDILPYYFSIADIFILPSLSEGRPMVIYEAMASECAIISTDVGSISEQIINNHNGLLIKPHDIDGLADKIEFLFTDNKFRNILGKNGRKRIFQEQWTWDNYSHKLIEIYKDLR